MSRSSQQHDQLLAMFAAVCDDLAGDEQIETLEALLREDPSAQELYLDYAQLHADLHWDEARQNAIEPLLMPTRLHPLGVWRWLGIAAAVALLAATGGWLMTRSPEAVSPSDSTPTFALLTNSTDAAWGATDLPTRLGSELAAGEVTLSSGTAQLMFHDGAVVELIAPVTFVIVDAAHARLISGRMSAYVPERAHGFTVMTDRVNVVDMGTEFGVEVDDLVTHVHVFNGQVVMQYGSQRIPLSAGEARTLGAGGEVTSLTAAPERFGVQVPPRRTVLMHETFDDESTTSSQSDWTLLDIAPPGEAQITIRAFGDPDDPAGRSLRIGSSAMVSRRLVDSMQANVSYQVSVWASSVGRSYGQGAIGLLREPPGAQVEPDYLDHQSFSTGHRSWKQHVLTYAPRPEDIGKPLYVTLTSRRPGIGSADVLFNDLTVTLLSSPFEPAPDTRETSSP